MNGQMPFDYTGQQNSVARRQKLADALLMQAFQPRQINQGGFGGALQALQPLMAAMLSQKLGAKADAEQAELGQRYRNDMAQGLQKYFATREGNPGTPMGPPTEEGAMGLTGATNPDPRRAAIEALTSNLPGLQKLGEMELMGKNDESFSNPVTERGQDGKLISVQYGNRGSRRVVAGSVPFEKPMSVADRVIDPANPQSPLADYSTRGGETLVIGGDLYQRDSQGILKKLDNAPKTTISVGGPTIVNKGETKFAETLGADIAGEFKAARQAAQQGYQTQAVVKQMQELEKRGVFSGPTANVATTLASVGKTLGLPVDAAKLANSEAFQQQFARQIAQVIAGSAGRSMTDQDRKALEQSIPSLLQSPGGRGQIYQLLNNTAARDIQRAQSFQQQLSQNPIYKDAAGMLTINPVDQQPGPGVVPPGPDQAVPGAVGPGSPMSLDDYLRQKRGR